MVVPTTHIETGVSEIGRWMRVRCTPTSMVRPLLARDYVGFVDSEPAFGHWLISPTATATIIVNLGAPFGGLPGAFVSGLDETYDIVERFPSSACIDLKLTPAGAYTVFGIPMGEIAGQVVAFEDIFGSRGREHVDRLRAAGSWEERLNLVDTFLLRRIDSGPRTAPPVEWAWHRLTESAGQVRVSSLASEIGWSHKHLIDMFRQQVGLPPKKLARILRFDSLTRQLDALGTVRWADLAAAHGYCDQAHLNRDFREFAGTTPSDFMRRKLEGQHVVGDEVKSFQDRAAHVA